MKKVMNDIKNESSAFYLVKSDDKTIGFLLMNCKGLESTVKENNVLEIDLLYILNEFRGNGFGTEIFQKTLDLSKQCNAQHLWVSVKESNEKAINFYNHLGMRKFATRLKDFQGEKYNDLLLKIKTNRNN
jgi:ribosomal protein S18 acetylase RimI-like enzyme